MNKGKRFGKGTQFIIIQIVLLLIMISICGCGRKTEMPLKNLAYGRTKGSNVVYIKEKEEYAPYLVLTADYNGNVLLLRKELLPEPMQYKVHGDLWAYYEYGSYYEESSVDEFLNTEFFNSLCESTRNLIVDSTIEVTDKESYDIWNYKTHEINRKVFLLSSVELGLKGLESITTKEGKVLKYFKNKDFSVKTAYLPEGDVYPYWTRTPELWESCTVVVIGTKMLGSYTADISCGVRPAFCMERNTVVKESADIIEGETVYVIEAEGGLVE